MALRDPYRSLPGRVRKLERAIDETGGGGGSGLQIRQDVDISSASLANGATQNGLLALAAGYRLMAITTSVPARLRIYTTTAARAADAARDVGVDPDLTTDHGLLFEFATADVLLTATLSPLVDGFIPAGSLAPYALTNLSGGTTPIDVSLTYLRTE